MEGHLRGIIGQLTVEEIVKQPEMVGDRMRSTCADDMNKMGLEVVSFTIKEVRDKNEYITNMGRPDARIKRDADVAAAEAERDTAIKRAKAQRAAAVAKALADQERVMAEAQSQAKQAEAQRDLEIKKATYLEMVKKQQAQADKTYEIQSNVMLQQVVAKQVKVQQVQKEQEIKVQEAEIQRRERNLSPRCSNRPRSNAGASRRWRPPRSNASLIKQVILDMQNQLLLVKTQVAIAIADEHVLQQKQRDNETKAAEWMRRAELAVDKQQDDLARAALERATSHQRVANAFAQQVADQVVQVDDLKSALRKLEQKLADRRHA